ncbi:ester cyclase [Pseudomonas izuensis]|uniref:ester cyclase n=1 Tax=Pseudomonas izuensis TaxID=2684212 RepID=UPI001358CAFD|nr:ester cyclase [Pseudomonas izuensis]
MRTLLYILLFTVMCASASAAQPNSYKQDVQRWYDAFDRNDPSLIDKILSDNWLDIPSSPDQVPGPAGAKAVLKHLHSTFSDFSIKIEEVLQDGNKVIVRSRISGIQTGTFAGVAPTHRRINIMATDIHEFQDGKIVRTWHMEDWMTGLHQLGVVQH